MKLKTWNNLQVGDKVTVRTVEEMLSLKNVQVDNVGDLLLLDSKTMSCYFIVDDEDCEFMSNFCGKTYSVLKKNRNSITLDGGFNEWKFTRKMLRDEVVKNEN